jgi:hypothetical protein
MRSPFDCSRAMHLKTAKLHGTPIVYLRNGRVRLNLRWRFRA